MIPSLHDLLFLAGLAQLGVLAASAMVPIQLKWHETFRSLPKLHRQLIWVYGGYIVFSILALAIICLVHARELASGSGLARAFCVYGMCFWGIRLALQGVFEVKPYLTSGWLKAGYHALTAVFVFLVIVYGWGAFCPN